MNFDDQFNTPLPEDPKEISDGIDEVIRHAGSVPPSPEPATPTQRPSLLELATNFLYKRYNPEKITKIETDPRDIDWRGLLKDIEPKKFGERTINPETQYLNFAETEVFIPDLKDFLSTKEPNYAKVYEVIEYVIKTYGNDYYIPGIEYVEWFLGDQNENPEALDGTHANRCFGSAVRNFDGRWTVPEFFWRKEHIWDGDYSEIKGSWMPRDRVILLKK
jgi:hypothetical protein